MRFKEGSKVEILKTDEVQHRSWFPAKVLSRHGDRYTIRYDPYLTSEGKPMVETVNEEDVRPCPPQANGKEKWAVGDTAELFDLDSWRLGKVAKVLKNDHIVARLFGSIQLKEFHISNLRVRQAWHNNKWIMIDKACEEKQFRNGHDEYRSSQYAKEFNDRTCRGIQDENVWTTGGDKQNSTAYNLSAGTRKRNLSSHCSLFPGDLARTCKKRKTNSRTDKHQQVPGKALPQMVDAVSVVRRKVGKDFSNTYSKGKLFKCAQMDAVNAYTNNHGIIPSSVPAQVTEENSECSVASCSGNGFSKSANKANRKGSKYTVNLDDAFSSCPSESGKDYQSTSGDEIAANIHELELHAYQSTMQALHASGPLSWEQESLLTNLRLSLNISIEEHSLHLRQLLSA